MQMAGKKTVGDEVASIGYLAGIIIGVLGMYLVISELQIMRKVAQVKKWPFLKQGGIVIDAASQTAVNTTSYGLVIVNHAYQEPNYRARVSFAYKINGITHISNKLSYNEAWESNPLVAANEMKLYTPGTLVDIYVNPHNFAEAYIENKEYHVYDRLLFGAVLALVGLYVLIKV